MKLIIIIISIFLFLIVVSFLISEEIVERRFERGLLERQKWLESIPSGGIAEGKYNTIVGDYQLYTLPDKYGNGRFLSLNGVTYAVPYNWTFGNLHNAIRNLNLRSKNE